MIKEHQTSDIDFVLAWVDGSDPEWQDQRNLYLNERTKCLYDLRNSDSMNGEARYRDWGLLRYWFRAVEKYAPWVRKIHFVTCGQVPEWLNLNHPKLNFVRHEDYIPKEWLPTFSANPIELNLFRIDGLSEKFVYFNDDMFLNAPVNPTDFFVNDLPRDCAVLSPLWIDDDGFSDIILNDLRVLHHCLDSRHLFKENMAKWFSPRYGLKLLKTLCLWHWRGQMSFYETHIPHAYLKSTFAEVWARVPQILEAVSGHRFRNCYEDVNQWLMRYWQLLSGKFHPRGPDFGCHYQDRSIINAVEDIKRQRHKVICLNEGTTIDFDFDEFKTSIDEAYRAVLPEKSAYEA